MAQSDVFHVVCGLYVSLFDDMGFVWPLDRAHLDHCLQLDATKEECWIMC